MLVKMQHLTRSQALEDVNNLIEVLVDAHPDPYFAFGGAIGFYRSFHNLVESLPNEGMSSKELYGRLQTFTSQLKDGHTKLFYEEDSNLRLPITFEVVENHLVVNGYYDPCYAWCIGSRVLEVDGLPVHKLLERLNWSAENEYVKLTELSWRIHSLSNRDTILALLTPSDSRVEVRLERTQYNGLTRPKSSFTLPNPNNKIDLSRIGSVTEKVSDFALGEVDGMPYFRIDGPFLYREAFEIYLKRTPSVLLRFGVTMKPEEFLSRLDAFRDKFEEVLEVVKSQKKILIDLRGATGGNSIITPLIIYSLFGYREAITPKEYAVTKLSKLSGANGKSKEGCGYDFSDEDLYYRVKKEGLTRELEEQYLKSSNGPNAYPWNFNREWQGIRDLKVCVSVSARTFSAGFDIALSLWKQGAKIVGTTPSQVANCFIDVIPFKLKNSGIEGQVATKLYIGLPERFPDMNILLRPHIELNYEYYRRSGFDPNAAIALCIKELK